MVIIIQSINCVFYVYFVGTQLFDFYKNKKDALFYPILLLYEYINVFAKATN